VCASELAAERLPGQLVLAYTSQEVIPPYATITSHRLDSIYRRYCLRNPCGHYPYYCHPLHLVRVLDSHVVLPHRRRTHMPLIYIVVQIVEGNMKYLHTGTDFEYAIREFTRQSSNYGGTISLYTLDMKELKITLIGQKTIPQ
jgi:hypothetical protein